MNTEAVILEYHEYEMPTRRIRQWTASDDDFIAEAVARGWTNAQIGEAVGASEWQTWDRRRILGLPSSRARGAVK